MDTYRILADAITALHALFVLFVAAATVAIWIGGLFRLRWVRNPWFRGIHLWMTIIVPFELACLNDFECPLTTWEWNLRIAGGEVKPDFRETGEVADTGFIARQLHEFVPEEGSMIIPGLFAGFGLAVLGAVVIFPPRYAAVVIAWNACSLAIAYVCWLYAGEPKFWGDETVTWPHGYAICVWNVLPFVVAAGMTMSLRRRIAASLLLCMMTLLLSGCGLILLHAARARIHAGASGLGVVEWLLPITELAVLGAAFGLMRVMVKRESPSAGPQPVMAATHANDVTVP